MAHCFQKLGQINSENCDMNSSTQVRVSDSCESGEDIQPIQLNIGNPFNNPFLTFENEKKLPEEDLNHTPSDKKSENSKIKEVIETESFRVATHSASLGKTLFESLV